MKYIRDMLLAKKWVVPWLTVFEAPKHCSQNDPNPPSPAQPFLNDFLSEQSRAEYLAAQI